MAQIVGITISFIVALFAIFIDERTETIRYLLTIFAIASLVVAVVAQIQSERHAGFVKRALENLIRSSIPSELFIKASIEIAVRKATQHGMNSVTVSEIQLDRGYRTILEFKDENDAVVALFVADQETFAEWSLLGDKALEKRIADDMFAPFIAADLDESWNTLCEFVPFICRILYRDSLPSDYNISRPDSLEKSIYVLAPQHAFKTEEEYLALEKNGRTLHLFRIGEPKLRQLCGHSRVKASELIAAWLKDAWGDPAIG